MTAGTASTMTACTETMGLALPGASSIPVSPGSSGSQPNAKRLLGLQAADANHQRMATHSGRRVVEMVREKLKPSKIVTPNAMRNAITW